MLKRFEFLDFLKKILVNQAEVFVQLYKHIVPESFVKFIMQKITL